jgi:Bacterial Ig-like domain
MALLAPASAAAGLRRHEAVRTLHRAEAVRAGHGVRTGFELTPLLKELAARQPDLSSRDRTRARRLMTRPTSGDAQPGEDEYSVPEAPPLCSAHFCIHWVATTADAPPSTDADSDGVPDYVETMSQVFENVRQVENVDMGWRLPVGDGTRGGDVNKTDVYIKQLGDHGIFGYSTPDPNQKGNSQFAYLALDNDFRQSEFPRYANPLRPMEVTAAHEYNHVLQFGYDWLQDTWMFEATAVWAEDKVYDAVNDYVAYLKRWVKLTRAPLTAYDAIDPGDPVNVKVYGDAVWNRWLEARYGQEVIRAAWENSLSTNPRSFAPGAYGAALRQRGGSLLQAFTRFAADTAEWRSSAGPFEEGASWPDIPRSKTLSTGGALTTHLDHTAYSLVNVAPSGDPRIRLVGKLQRGTPGAVALVGRQGPATTGALEVRLKRVPSGGRVRVELANPSRFSRITAVLVNAGVAQDGFDPYVGDWDFARADGKRVDALITNDFVAPRVVGRKPQAGKQGVSRTPKVAIRFSEPVAGIGTGTLRLLDPTGHHVGARVTYDAKARRALLTPKARLAAHTSYEVELTGGIVDRGANAVPAAARGWTFRTGA